MKKFSVLKNNVSYENRTSKMVSRRQVSPVAKSLTSHDWGTDFLLVRTCVGARAHVCPTTRPGMVLPQMTKDVFLLLPLPQSRPSDRGSLLLSLTSNLLWSWGWLWISDLHTSTAWVLRSEVCPTILAYEGPGIKLRLSSMLGNLPSS